MTRRIKRLPDFEVTLEIKNDGFIRPPRDSQRNWLLNKALSEFASDLTALDPIARSFAPGSEAIALADRAHDDLSDEEIMEDWQIPIMRAMAEAVAAPDRDLLEIGFGRGISSGFIQQIGVKSHTLVECNESVIERFHVWRRQFPDRDIRLIAGRWQDVTDRFGVYDAIFFHTYALNEDDYIENALQSVTFAEHFFPTAAAHLREGGVFTYLTNEIDSLSRAHQRLVFRYFRSFALGKVEPLNVPNDIRDTWWANSMVVIKATK
jgi:guanidinoacetate N-methyltransferase